MLLLREVGVVSIVMTPPILSSRRRYEGKSFVFVGLANGHLVAFDSESIKVHCYNKLFIYLFIIL